ncbi:MAG: lipoyl(octanoyl) transferase LipB [Desulfobacterales bacterium]|nr:lipoyl(octanoyl) transferase LipB [Desulfobacterales bacterium]
MNTATSPPCLSSGSRSRCYCVSLPLTDYQQVWHLQKELVAARKDKIIDADTVLILEHPAVFTFGRRGGIENLTVSQTFLEETGIGLIQVERGGSITFHGPGQVVVYLIMDIQAAGISVTGYVTRLEEIMLQTAADWGVAARRHPLNRGIWVDLKKMGSVGIAVRHGITFHGMALNVDLSLDPFSWIHPCGLKGIRVTSLAKESGQAVSISKVRAALKRHIESVFGVRLETIDLPVLQERLCKAAAA